MDGTGWFRFGATVLAAAIASSSANAQHTETGAPPYGHLSWIQVELDPRRQPTPVGQWWLWVGEADFPKAAQAPRTVTRFRLRIGPDGKIMSCASPRDSDPAIAKRTCDLFRQRGRFQHAIAFDGQPVESDVEFTLTMGVNTPSLAEPAPKGGWTVPALPPPPSGPAVIRRPARTVAGPLSFTGAVWAPRSRPASVTVAVSAEGRVTRCTIRYSTGTQAGDAALCAAVQQTRFAPAENSDGKPIDQDTLTVYLTVGPR